MHPFLFDVIETIPWRLFQIGTNLEIAIFSSDGRRVVKLQGTATRRTRIVVGLVQSCPHWIMSILKGSVGCIELIRHDLQRGEQTDM